MDRARVFIERNLVTAGPQIEVHTFDAATTSHDVASFAGDDILAAGRISFSSLGVLYTEFVGNFEVIRLRSVADSGNDSGASSDIATIDDGTFPGIDPQSNVDAVMVQVGANEVDIVVSYRDTASNYRLYLLRHDGLGVTPTAIDAGLSSAEAEVTAVTHHDGLTYVYAGQVFGGGKIRQYRLDPVNGVNESRELDPPSSGIFAYGTTPGAADRYSVVTIGAQVELRAGEVPLADLPTFQFIDLAVSDTWVTIADIPVNNGAYSWLDRTFMMLGAPSGDSSQMNYFIMGPNGAVLAEAGLPFTGNVRGGTTRAIDEVAVVKREAEFPPEGGDVHAIWIESQYDSSQQREQMYYDVLRCLPQ
ncbi:MAG TPA: hypothetical protein ENK57_00010 [Polyangiaceae bacterium]|nr:hypothetical protein [Polyangiaceae bacterium]